MELFNAPLEELKEYKQVLKSLQSGDKKILMTGCTQSGKMHFIQAFGASFDVRIIITHDDLKAAEIAEEYRMYDKDVRVFPAKDLIFYQADIYSNRITADRMKVLRSILERKPITVVTTFDTFQAPFLPMEVIKDHVLKVRTGSIMSEDALAVKLSGMGYHKTQIVELPGDFAIRGGIVDIFDLTNDNPIRIELWGDEVESVRIFDAESQRSLATVKEACIYPACEMLMSKEVRAEGFARIEREVKK